MITDRDLLDDLHDLPGWGALFSADADDLIPDDAVARAESAVHAAIAADLRSLPSLAARRRRTRRWAIAGVAAAAAAAVVVAAPTLSTPGSSPVSVASASGFLTHLAATSPVVRGLDDAYWKVEFTGVNPRNPAAGSDQEQRTTLWYGRTGGQWVLTGGDERVAQGNVSEAVFDVPPFTQLTWNQVRGLSSDPADLEAYLTKIVAPRGTQPGGSLVVAAESLLATAPLSRPQRAALFTILSHQPDVTIREHVADHAGRVGTALGFPLGDTITMTLLLADDGTLLEETEVATRDQAEAVEAPHEPGVAPSSTAVPLITQKGALLSRQTYLTSAGTNTPPGN